MTTTEDRSFFRAALKIKANEISEMHKVAIKTVDDASLDVDRIGMDAILDKTEFDRHLIPMLSAFYRPEDVQKEKRSMAIKNLRLSRSMDYTARAREKVTTLVKIVWPKPKQ